MRMEMDVALDPTLGCGQAHRWRKNGDVWEGVIGNDAADIRQTEDGLEFSGTSESALKHYFRAEDDLKVIYSDISSRDNHVSSLAVMCPGMRILRQPAWECTATYILATNANVKRIGCMIDSVCRELGRDIGKGRASFPSPADILEGIDRIDSCRLGYRKDRLIMLAQIVEDGILDPEALKEMDYPECRRTLLGVTGIGPKVADCVCLFAYGHLEAFPVDARISRSLEKVYGVRGGYDRLAAFGRERFGSYAGYAQELLYHSDIIMRSRSQAHSGGEHHI